MLLNMLPVFNQSWNKDWKKKLIYFSFLKIYSVTKKVVLHKHFNTQTVQWYKLPLFLWQSSGLLTPTSSEPKKLQNHQLNMSSHPPNYARHVIIICVFVCVFEREREIERLTQERLSWYCRNLKALTQQRYYYYTRDHKANPDNGGKYIQAEDIWGFVGWTVGGMYVQRERECQS